jgi:hypothetical protein
MNQIRTYSKTRPKSVILYEKEDTIFQSINKKSKSDNGVYEKCLKFSMIFFSDIIPYFIVLFSEIRNDTFNQSMSGVLAHLVWKISLDRNKGKILC